VFDTAKNDDSFYYIKCVTVGEEVREQLASRNVDDVPRRIVP
jgi:hypothetical protein